MSQQTLPIVPQPVTSPAAATSSAPRPIDPQHLRLIAGGVDATSLPRGSW